MTALKGAGNVAVSFNGNALTNYTNTVDLQNTIAELEATHLGSEAMESDAGLPSYSLQLGGDWRAALDAILGPDSLTGVKRTTVITFTDGSDDVSYTWTASGDVGGFITNYAPKTSATDKIAWSATLRLSGIPVRAVA
jgi:hypothetical protein